MLNRTDRRGCCLPQATPTDGMWAQPEGTSVPPRPAPELHARARSALGRARQRIRLAHPGCFQGGPDSRLACQTVRGLDHDLEELEATLDEALQTISAMDLRDDWDDAGPNEPTDEDHAVEK